MNDENNTRKCCKNPYTHLEIQGNGNCYFCCPSFIKNEISIGNIFEQSFEEVWYGEKATEFRKSVLDGSYSKCDLTLCPFDAEGFFFYEDYLYPPYPKFVALNYVGCCNVRCITCRDNLYCETKDKTEYYNQFKDRIVQLCSRAKYVYLNGSGSLFVSNHLKGVCHEILKVNPYVRFILCSNGLLFNEAHVRDFNLLNNLYHVQISIHAAKKKVYEKIVRGGKWEVLQKNLSYISNLKKEGKITKLEFNFVTHSLNYKEMPRFVKMAQKFGATPVFWRFRKWNNASEMNRNYEKYTVWEKDHKDYKKFLKVMKKLQKIDVKICFHDPLFQKLYDQKYDTWLDKLKNIIFRR